ncbi:hypothetical protein [Myroides sp. LJL119]
MKKFLAMAFAITLCLTIWSCSSSDDEVIRTETPVQLYPGLWETDMLTYNIPNIHSGTYKYSQMTDMFGEEFFTKETFEIVSNNEIILKQYTGKGEVKGPFVGKLEDNYLVFNSGIEKRKISKSNEFEFTLVYDMFFFNTKAPVEVTQIRASEK